MNDSNQKRPDCINQVRQFAKFVLLPYSLCFCLFSCKTSFEIHKEPSKPSVVAFEGSCLVNRIHCPHTIKNEKAFVKVMLNQLTRIDGAGIRYIGHLKGDEIVQGQIPYNPQPELMDTLNQLYKFKYLISISAEVNEYTSGGFGISTGTMDLDHEATAVITVIDLEEKRHIYWQEITLVEYWDSGTELDDPEDKSNMFQTMYSSEKLMQRAVKKAAYNLRVNSNKAKQRMIKE